MPRASNRLKTTLHKSEEDRIGRFEKAFDSYVLFFCLIYKKLVLYYTISSTINNKSGQFTHAALKKIYIM